MIPLIFSLVLGFQASGEQASVVMKSVLGHIDTPRDEVVPSPRSINRTLPTKKQMGVIKKTDLKKTSKQKTMIIRSY